jgi:hypothetical protein
MVFFIGAITLLWNPLLQIHLFLIISQLLSQRTDLKWPTLFYWNSLICIMMVTSDTFYGVCVCKRSKHFQKFMFRDHFRLVLLVRMLISIYFPYTTLSCFVFFVKFSDICNKIQLYILFAYRCRYLVYTNRESLSSDYILNIYLHFCSTLSGTIYL